MALADYYQRSAVAISQVIQGYDEAAIRQKLDATLVEIVVSQQDARSREARNAADLLVRLVARLYPRIRILAAHSLGGELATLARRINPNVDLAAKANATHSVVVGREGQPSAQTCVFVGSDGWIAKVSSRRALPVGPSSNPFGAGAAACLAVGELFRSVFTSSAEHTELNWRVLPAQLGGDASFLTEKVAPVLVGAGAIGQGAVWALSRFDRPMSLTVVDPERVDLGNLQRYVLSERSDVGRPKVALVKRVVPNAVSHEVDWQTFAATKGTFHPLVLTALDSAVDRRAVQSSLPKFVLNAWTQAGDLGVSGHDFVHGACLVCLYLPSTQSKNEDQIFAEALGIPDQLASVRLLLHTGDPVPDQMLLMIADRLRVPRETVQPFSGRPIRDLYSEGICGGVVLPLGETGYPRTEVHVPLAHQSALAGVLLASRIFSTRRSSATLVTRLDVLRRIQTRYVTQPRAKDPRGICICQDPDFVARYRAKYPQVTPHLARLLQK